MSNYTEWKALEAKLTDELHELNWKASNERTRANLEALKKVVNKLRKVKKVISEIEA